VELLEERRLLSTLTVMNANDGGAGSLRQAITDASPDDTILFAPGLAPIVLTGGELVINKDLTIAGNGPAATVIDGNAKDRVFDIQQPEGVAITVTISGLTIRNGVADEGGGVFVFGAEEGATPVVTLANDVVSGNTAAFGGGIAAEGGGDGAVIIMDTTVDGNTAGGSEGQGEGGGVFTVGITLAVLRSTISNNHADAFSGDSAGGGLWLDGPATITNSTVSDNAATADPSDIGQGGGLFVGDSGNVQLTNVTVADNQATGAGGASQVGGIYNGGSDDPAVTLQNTLVAGSEPGGTNFGGPGAWADLGNNLSSDGSGVSFLNDPSDLNNTDPRLGPLQDNGGPTFTRALLPGSPAQDAGADGVVDTDQRGLPRPGGPHTDIGAFEAEQGPPGLPGAGSPSISLNATSAVERAGHFVPVVTGTNLTFGPGSVVLVDGVPVRSVWLDGTHLEVPRFPNLLDRLARGEHRRGRRLRRFTVDEGSVTVAVRLPGGGVSPPVRFTVLEAVAPGDAGTPRERRLAEAFESLTGKEAHQSPLFQAILRTLRARP
jgi:hypothetical protein